ncbi:hypothetical protein ACFE04_008151 [Oxalis oulophora]
MGNTRRTIEARYTCREQRVTTNCIPLTPSKGYAIGMMESIGERIKFLWTLALGGEINKALAALCVHTPVGETMGQLDLLSTTNMDGWMAGLGAALPSSTDATWPASIRVCKTGLQLSTATFKEANEIRCWTHSRTEEQGQVVYSDWMIMDVARKDRGGNGDDETGLKEWKTMWT